MKKNKSHQVLYRIFYVLFIPMLVCSCTGKTPSAGGKTGSTPPSRVKPETYHKPPSQLADTLVVNPGAAVFYFPDSIQLLHIRAVRDKNIFETEEHYCEYQTKNARLLLKKAWPQIHIMETSRHRYLLFIKKDKNNTCIDLDDKSDMCGVFLFDGIKEPELADMMNFDNSLRFYFVH